MQKGNLIGDFKVEAPAGLVQAVEDVANAGVKVIDFFSGQHHDDVHIPKTILDVSIHVGDPGKTTSLLQDTDYPPFRHAFSHLTKRHVFKVSN